MGYNYSKLQGRIVEICGNQGNFADLMGLSKRSLSLKLNNKVVFKQDEISTACEVLKLTTEEISLYFFNRKVQ
ncbi:MAG: DUF739 family protein [Lachnospirales bacterium]